MTDILISTVEIADETPVITNSTITGDVLITTVELVDSVTVDGAGVTVTVVEGSVGAEGPPGPVGPQGPTGPQGPVGPLASATTYSLVAAPNWTQVHTVDYPNVRLVDSTGEAVDIGVEYPDTHTAHIQFPAPFTGTVIFG